MRKKVPNLMVALVVPLLASCSLFGGSDSSSDSSAVSSVSSSVSSSTDSGSASSSSSEKCRSSDNRGLLSVQRIRIH